MSEEPEDYEFTVSTTVRWPNGKRTSSGIYEYLQKSGWTPMMSSLLALDGAADYVVAMTPDGPRDLMYLRAEHRYFLAPVWTETTLKDGKDE